MDWDFDFATWQQLALMKRLGPRLDSHVGPGHGFAPRSHLPVFVLAVSFIKSRVQALDEHPGIWYAKRIHHHLKSQTGDSVVAATTLAEAATTSVGPIKMVMRSHLNAKIDRAIDDIESRKGGEAMRLLMVPACYLTTLWLKGSYDRHEVYLVDTPSGYQLPAGSRVDPARFLEATRNFCHAHRLLERSGIDAATATAGLAPRVSGSDRKPVAPSAGRSFRWFGRSAR